VTEKDLAFFQYRVEQSGEIPGSSDWDLMLDKHINKQLKYQAWRRTLPVSDEPIIVPKAYYHSRVWIGCRHLLRLHDFHYSPHPVPDAASVADLCSSGLTTQDGKTEYKSVTISYDTTAEEIMDIYFDDDFRPQWVSHNSGMFLALRQAQHLLFKAFTSCAVAVVLSCCSSVQEQHVACPAYAAQGADCAGQQQQAHDHMLTHLLPSLRLPQDTMVKEHEVLEHGDFSQRQQVVRWLRKFPFHFLSAREYVIGRRRFKQGDTLYGMSKVSSSAAAWSSSFV
jgi:hypothetical protein